MARNFEVFTARNKPLAKNGLRASLTKRGVFSFNHAAYAALGEPSAVVLMYDKNSGTIGIKPVDISIRHSYPVRVQPNARSYMVGAIAFLGHYEIPHPRSMVFTPSMEDGILVLDLASAVEVTRRSRKKEQATIP